MSRSKSVRKSKPAIRTPKLSKHQNGQAYITVQQHRYYLGIYGSDEALRRYQEAIRQLNSTGIYQPPVEQTICKSIDELILGYLTHCEPELLPNNHSSKEFYHRRLALNHLSTEFGAYLGNDFGPKYLKHMQQLLIKNGLSARYINKLINRIKSFVRWCCSEELIDSTIYSKLESVESIKAGKQGTQPAKKVQPVSITDIEAVMPYLKPEIQDMIRVQFYCGMRPQDVTNMRPCDIDQTGAIWKYYPFKHKNAWRSQTLTKAIPGPAQAILEPYLAKMCGQPEAYLFSPAQSEAARIGKCIQRRSRPLGEKYTTSSYCHALNHGFQKAARQNVQLKHWSPNQLRHSIATLISANFGQQSAQVFLGHSHLDTTKIYTERTVNELVTVAEKVTDLLASKADRLKPTATRKQSD